MEYQHSTDFTRKTYRQFLKPLTPFPFGRKTQTINVQKRTPTSRESYTLTKYLKH